MVRLRRAAIADDFRRQVEGKARAPVKSVRQGQQHVGRRLPGFPGRGSGAKAMAAAKTPFHAYGTIHDGDCSVLCTNQSLALAACF